MIALLGILAAAAAPSPQDALGRWQTETKHGVVEIAACGPSICGRLVESDALRTNPQLRDIRNKDAAQRDRMLKGLTILQGFHAKSGEWAGGTIYNGDDGGTYQATLTMIDRDTLKVKGCIVWPLCKSQTWKRLR
ncbi:DUF2147 domain-containing protein [Novosphingobium humi]|uniref:DUF2147 domain-containing protein n=1 Tax=Novosphingobium humi TaxID=2282397 RepID=A0ABY7TYU1_9SPHN|nr:DUF2147 domain-containing protein [Novosphingobium humi]WCT76989.1 DUF2147 domain-containing protein [Novosphingobium humi]WJS99491.1 DUF2147 domain-containing protein [Novosphingobium humi]